MSTQHEIQPTPAADVGAVEETLLEELAGRLGGSLAEELTEGGSPARLSRLELPGRDPQVLKLLVDIPGAVDGHDLESFRVKIRQIEKIRTDLPALHGVYTDLSHEFHGDNWAAYTMPYYPNRDIAAPLRDNEDIEKRYAPQLRRILTDLIGAGYLHSDEETGPGNIADVHGDRLVRRFWLLQRYLPGALVDADTIVVNGVECRNPLKLAQTLLDDPRLTAHVDARRLYYPVHGDLNTRNILVTDDRELAAGTGGYRIIDPRGTLGHWDPAYDLSKILFSFTVWDAGLRKGFRLDNQGAAWQVAIDGGNYPSYDAAARRLLGLMRGLPAFQELTEHDPGWESRYLLGHAFHLLGEAACRLSDIKKRTGEDSEDQLDPVDLAAGHYLYGVLFLEDAVRQLETEGRVDNDAALAHLG
ncbi:hypothetical protein [Actinacidiphila sp. ITFR-21]|uniref:hypothetical protein n=1 Tax=Actinacidiphila sp. ITFR-21 TaxID=3075199 RepID=UPI00288A9CFF|nr:hypothetical protein [Streptomyces sp. ITFR-21]WNI18808.1 hypothetical protein RLT57_26955 [Streptomyces sp. ITFR-21]